MNPIFAGAEIHRAPPPRIAGPARHETRQVRLARDHLRRRVPIRSFRLAADGLNAGPGEAFAADADAVPNGAALAKHVIESSVAGIDNDRARRLAGVDGNNAAPQPLRDYAPASI